MLPLISEWFYLQRATSQLGGDNFSFYSDTVDAMKLPQILWVEVFRWSWSMSPPLVIAKYVSHSHSFPVHHKAVVVLKYFLLLEVLFSLGYSSKWTRIHWFGRKHDCNFLNRLPKYLEIYHFEFLMRFRYTAHSRRKRNRRSKWTCRHILLCQLQEPKSC